MITTLFAIIGYFCVGYMVMHWLSTKPHLYNYRGDANIIEIGIWPVYAGLAIYRYFSNR